MTHLEAGQALHDLADTLQRVSLGKERIVLQSHGSDVAALVPVEDLSLLERAEDFLDIKAAEAAEAEAHAQGQPAVPWEEARRQLGL